MSINSLKKELCWTRVFVIVLIIAVFLCNAAIHADYERFREVREDLNKRIIALEQPKDCSKFILKNEIMKSCFVGRKLH